MTIGIMINCLEIGGAQRMALRLLDVLDRAGHQVLLIAIDGTRDMELHPDPQRHQELMEHLVHLSELDTNSGTMTKICTAFGQYLRLHRVKRQYGIKTIVSFEDRANIFNLLTLGAGRRILSVRHPMVSLGRLKAPLKRVLIEIFFSLFARRAAVVNFNSEEAMQEFRDRYRLPDERLSVIPNFCNHEALERDRRDYPVDDQWRDITDRPFVLACGRLREVKGYEHLIRAFSRVHRHCPEVLLVMVGDGPLRGDLEQLARDLELGDTVRFVGFQHHSAAWIAAADVFALTSLSEGFPNVLLEALALRTAVVSTDCISGPREILSPGGDCRRKATTIDSAEFGVLVPPMRGGRPTAEVPLDQAEEQLAEAMTRLLQDSDMRQAYADKGYQRSLDYTADSQQRRWFELLDSP